MEVELLSASNLRCFARVRLAPGPRINWLVGANGAGKTTLLEAAYILSHGRSFRPGGRTAPRRDGADSYSVYAEIRLDGGTLLRLGLLRTEDRWEARRDGARLTTLAPLFEACPTVYFGPETQALLVGPAEERRALLDWAVFHVEQVSLGVWKAWRRALRQRNALIRQGAPAVDFSPWEQDLGRLGERIDRMRQRCLVTLEPYLVAAAQRLVPELGPVRMGYRRGWDPDVALDVQLATHRDRDREKGYTWYGAHRADWFLAFGRVAHRQHLSRGQTKAAALACMLALTQWLKDRRGAYPLLCLDDLESELDAPHVASVMAWLAGKPIQSWLTTTDSEGMARRTEGARVFHVEQTGCERVCSP